MFARSLSTGWNISTTEKLFGPVDPLFPATEIVQDQYHLFQTGGLSRAHWSNATPIRAIFKEAFTSAGLAYANPHSFRKTLAQLGERLCRTPEEFKAWSQNLGHEQVLTTFSSYGQVGADRQAELIRHLAQQARDRRPQGGDDRPYDPSLAGGKAHPGMIRREAAEASLVEPRGPHLSSPAQLTEATRRVKSETRDRQTPHPHGGAIRQRRCR